MALELVLKSMNVGNLKNRVKRAKVLPLGKDSLFRETLAIPSRRPLLAAVRGLFARVNGTESFKSIALFPKAIVLATLNEQLLKSRLDPRHLPVTIVNLPPSKDNFTESRLVDRAAARVLAVARSGRITVTPEKT